MRLEKHTDEEIEQARKESGTDSLTPEQVEEWQQVHKKINKEMADSEAARFSGQVINLQGVVLTYLKGRALRLAQSFGSSTVMEILKNKSTGARFPWYKSELLGYECITEEALEGAEFAKEFVVCRYLCKTIEIDKGDAAALEYWIKRFAALFTKLAEARKIEYGVLGPFMALPLADLDAHTAGEAALRVAMEAGAKLTPEKLKEIEQVKARVTAEATTRRYLLMVYPYSHLETEELNKWLRNAAFVEEGALGGTDWAGLPDA